MKIILERISEKGGEITLDISITEGKQRKTKRLTVFGADIGIGKSNTLPAEGDELSEEEFEMLCAADAYRSAVRKGADILARAGISCASLKAKLTAGGIDEDTAQRAVDYLVSRGFIREAEDAGRIVSRYISRGYGPRRILMCLREKRYPDEVLQEVKQNLADMDFAPVCAEAILKKYGVVPDDRRGLEKMAAAMQRYGYSYDDIKRAVRLLRERDGD